MRLPPIALPLLLLAGFSQTAQADALQVWNVPGSLTAGQTFDWQVALYLDPGSSQQISAWQFDVLFSTELSALSVTELGYFSANGVFFTPGTPGIPATPGLSGLYAISDLLFFGDYLPASDALFVITFQALQDIAAPSVTLNNEIVLLSDGFSDAVLGSVQFVDPPGSGVPEPGTAGMCVVALLALGVGARLNSSLRRQRQ